MALRNINLVVQKRPDILKHEMKVPPQYSTSSSVYGTPLVMLLSADPEVQYVALRNINLVVQKRPDILKHEMKVPPQYYKYLYLPKPP